MNILAIVLGALVVMVSGMVWFHPKVFGKGWMTELGLTEEDVNKVNPVVMVGALLMAGVVAYAMSRYAGHTEEGMHQFVHGMYHGFMPAILYVAPVLVSKSLFEQKSLPWILTVVAYWVVTLTLVGGVVYFLTPVKAAVGG